LNLKSILKRLGNKDGVKKKENVSMYRKVGHKVGLDVDPDREIIEVISGSEDEADDIFNNTDTKDETTGTSLHYLG
jgi:hypothetical protein